MIRYLPNHNVRWWKILRGPFEAYKERRCSAAMSCFVGVGGDTCRAWMLCFVSALFLSRCFFCPNHGAASKDRSK